MSLRQIAKELDISPAYLSYMLNGKRPWRKDLYQPYMGVVNTFVNSEAENVNNKHGRNLDVTQKMTLKKPRLRGAFLRLLLERKTRFELATSSLARKAESKLNRSFTTGKQRVD